MEALIVVVGGACLLVGLIGGFLIGSIAGRSAAAADWRRVVVKAQQDSLRDGPP